MNRRLSARTKRLLGWPLNPWVVPVPVRPADVMGPEPLLFGIVAAWEEGDVIAAAVQNAFHQGCSRVFLIDNGSTDSTIAEGTGAGAELVETYETDSYDEPLRIAKICDWIEQISRDAGNEQIWWLLFDADEFTQGPYGWTIRDYLRRLDGRFRVVGSTVYNHYPSPASVANVPGRHPAEFQPLCERYALPGCITGHYKHPVLRFDRDAPVPLLRPGNGFHAPKDSGSVILEPVPGLVTHHFPFRSEESTRRRLRIQNERTTVPMPSQDRELAIDAIYAGDRDSARLRRTRLGDRAIRPRPWWRSQRSRHRAISRWYPDGTSSGHPAKESLDGTA